MSYTTREQWQSFMTTSISELRKIAIDKLNEPGNQVHPGTKNAGRKFGIFAWLSLKNQSIL